MLLRSTLCVQNWVKLCWTGHRGAPQTRHSSPSKVFTLPLIICLQLRHMRTLHLHLKVGSRSRCVPATYFYPGRLSQPLRSIAFWETRMISLAPPFAEDPLPTNFLNAHSTSIKPVPSPGLFPPYLMRRLKPLTTPTSFHPWFIASRSLLTTQALLNRRLRRVMWLFAAYRSLLLKGRHHSSKIFCEVT